MSETTAGGQNAPQRCRTKVHACLPHELSELLLTSLAARRDVLSRARWFVERPGDKVPAYSLAPAPSPIP